MFLEKSYKVPLMSNYIICCFYVTLQLLLTSMKSPTWRESYFKSYFIEKEDVDLELPLMHRPLHVCIGTYLM